MIARKSFLIVISNILVQFIGWIGLVVLAKLWGGFAPEALGVIGFAMSFIALFNIVSDLGFSSAHVKRISEGKDLGVCIGTYVAIKIILIGLMVTITLSAIFIWKTFFHGGFTDATTESLIYVFLVYHIFSTILSIPLHTFIAKKEIVKKEIPALFGRIAKVALVILVALAGVNTLGTVIPPAVAWPQFLQPIQNFIATHATGSLAMTYVLDMIVAFFITLWFLRKYPLKKPSWKLGKSYFSFALPIMLISVIDIISHNIDKVMIGYFWTSTEVGYYFTVQRILIFVTILSAAVGTLLFPAISEQHTSKSFPKITRKTHQAERYISMVSIPPIVIMIIFAKPVINIILSSAFFPAAPVLIVLLVYAFIYNLNMPYGSLIKGINKPGAAAKIGFIICATNIPLNYLFIPEQGLLSPFGINGPTGAAAATCLSMAFGFVGYRIAAKRFVGMKFLYSHILRHLVAGLAMGGVLYYLNILIPLTRWYHLLGFAFVGLGVYIGVLFVLREFKKQDLLFFLDLLNLKKMFNYIKSELKEK